MNVQLIKRGIRIDPESVVRIKEELLKIGKLLPDLSEDTLIIFFVSKNLSKYHPFSKYKKHHDYLSSKMKIAHFGGWIKLALPRKALYAKFEGLTIPQVIKSARKNIVKEIKKYKELHFKSQSKYPDKKSIRRDSG